MHQTIKISTKAERRLIASILVSEGYTVKESVIYEGKTKRIVIEFWEGNDEKTIK